MFTIIGRCVNNLLFIFLLFSLNIIADSINISHRTSSRQTGNHPYVQLTLNKHEFFIGEYVPFKLRVSYDAHVYDVQNIVQPQAASYAIKEISKPKKWKDTVTDSWITEWEGTLYATQEGRFSCGPFQVLMQERMPHGMSNWSFFIMQQTVSVASNTVGYRALPFPVAPDRAMHPIGNFRSAYFEVDQHDFTSGQAITMRMHVAGTGYVPHDAHPRLELPEGLKWYLANMHQDQDGLSFEYVIQALHEAIFVIPAQKCIFFDPETKNYKTLMTESVRLYVSPGVQPSATQMQEPEVQELQQEIEAEDEKVLNEKVSVLRTMYIPDMIVFWFLTVIIVAACCYRMRVWLKIIMQKLHKKWVYRKLIKSARAKVRHFAMYPLQKREDMLYLYEIFKKLETAVDWEHLQIIEQEKMNYEQWKVFWHQLEFLRFADDEEHDKNIMQASVQQALQWLLFFEKKIL